MRFSREWSRGNSSPRHEGLSQVPGRYGWFGGLGTYWFSDPGRDFVGALLTQRAYDESSPQNDFWKAAYQAMKD
jgi:CubicO group peptidase (beta-lactamase class C family)